MNSCPTGTANAAAAEALAARYVWWQPVTETLAERRKLLCAIMRLGTAADYVVARDLFGEAAFAEALRAAGPGDLDERSWYFWHRHFGREPGRYPQRRFA